MRMKAEQGGEIQRRVLVSHPSLVLRQYQRRPRLGLIFIPRRCVLVKTFMELYNILSSEDM